VTTALAGVLVADFSRVLAGPYATMLLGDLGAEVVKVERPYAGDDTRQWGPPWRDSDRGRESTYFLGVNRNKRSVWLDLRDDADRQAAAQLAARADVVVENFAPGTMQRFGLGYEQVSAANPGVVYASITGFGSGPGAELPGYDLLAQAVGGLMSITGPGPDDPTKVGVALVDVICGLHATVGILAALQHRTETGLGQLVEVNLLSSLLSALTNQASAYVAGGVVPGILGNRHPSICPYEVFQTADRPLVLAVGNDEQFRRLCGVLGLLELAQDERFATNPGRVAARDELVPLLGAALAQRSASEWFELLSAAGVPAGPINDLAAAVDLADRLGLDPIVEVDSVPTVANPIRLSATPVQYRSGPPQR
jgi:crotonobetainyl-CoA:carnitine CoA-transferase CaiB-like acyl-CoA transferase